MAVKDTVADKLINCTLVILKEIGVKDEVVCTGQVPEAKVQEIYAKMDQKKGLRSFLVAMEKGG